MLNCTRASELDFLFPEGDSVVGPSLQKYGEFAAPELDFLLAAAQEKNGTLIDVGANIGAIALPFAKQRPKWQIIAIEAHRGLAGLLAANAINNHLYNVEVINAAVGEERKIVEFPTHKLDSKLNFGDSGFHQSSAPLQTILMLQLDELAPNETSIIKIDVQGFEPNVLKGSNRLVSSSGAIWFLEAPIDTNARTDSIDILMAAGLSLYWFFSPFGTKISPRNTTDQLVGDVNIVAVPPNRALPWKLKPIANKDEPRPLTLGAYPYLENYGFPYRA